MNAVVIWKLNVGKSRKLANPRHSVGKKPDQIPTKPIKGLPAKARALKPMRKSSKPMIKMT
jgi:hypothetical protein